MAEINLTENHVELLRHMVEIQGYKGNYDYDEYMHGMFNGMELMLATIESRPPLYKNVSGEYVVDKAEEPVVSAEGEVLK